MNLKGAQLVSLIWNIVCIVAAIASELAADSASLGIPPKIAHGIAIVALGAMWIRSHWNLFVNPDGTSAKTAYIPPPAKP